MVSTKFWAKQLHKISLFGFFVMAVSSGAAHAGLRAPQALTAKLNAVGIKLKWTDPNVSESGYLIERRSSLESVFSPLNRIAANTTSYIDTSIKPGQKYYYRLRAFQNTAMSPWSETISAKTPEQISGPGLSMNTANSSEALGYDRAIIDIRHSFVGDLVVVVGIGSPLNPHCEVVVSNRQWDSAIQLLREVDLSLTPCFQPVQRNFPWYVRVRDDAPVDSGFIVNFQVILKDGTVYTAPVLPVEIPDRESAFAIIPSALKTVCAHSSAIGPQAAALIFNGDDQIQTSSTGAVCSSGVAPGVGPLVNGAYAVCDSTASAAISATSCREVLPGELSCRTVSATAYTNAWALCDAQETLGSSSATCADSRLPLSQGPASSGGRPGYIASCRSGVAVGLSVQCCR